MELPAKTTQNRPLPRHSHRLACLGPPIAAIAIALAIPLAVALTIEAGHFGAGHVGQATRVPDVVLLYVGAEDCAPCRAWQRDDRPGFLASPEFPHIHYHEIKSPSLVDVLKDENWPAELRSYRSQLKQGDGVPLWMIVSDDRLVERQSGASAWRETIMPKLRKLVGAAPG